jgi:hypothetical protein
LLLLSVGLDLGHYLALAAVACLITTHWWLTYTNMQNDFAVA